MHTFIGLFSGIFLTVMVYFMFNSYMSIVKDRRREKAREVLQKHGLKPYLYLATFGEEEPELRAALDEFTFSGYIITDTENAVVGKIVLTAQKKPYLKLVSSRD